MTRELTFREALREALREEMRQDSTVFLLGEDIGRHGGAHKVTEGLLDEFGEKRVMDMPLSESAIIGAAVGAAIMGMRPVAEIMFGDFLFRITEPALRPIRNILPDLGGIDISPVILILIIIFIRYVIALYILPNVY